MFYSNNEGKNSPGNGPRPWLVSVPSSSLKKNSHFHLVYSQLKRQNPDQIALDNEHNAKYCLIFLVDLKVELSFFLIGLTSLT